MSTQWTFRLCTYLSTSFRITDGKKLRTFSRPHPTMHGQQNRCPHSVAQLEVLSSRHNVQFLLALTSSGICEKSRTVCSSSSAGTGAEDSFGMLSMTSDIGMPSMDGSADLSRRATCLPFNEAWDSCASSLIEERRYSRIAANNR